VEIESPHSRKWKITLRSLNEGDVREDPRVAAGTGKVAKFDSSFLTDDVPQVRDRAIRKHF
jgi:hypothetical protein